MLAEKTAPEQQFAHWMLKEIHEQPAVLRATLQAATADGAFHAETFGAVEDWLEEVRGKIVIAASGSSRHAGLAGEMLIEELSGVPVDVEYASEFSDRDERALQDASVVVISQSGETADTLAALRRAKRTRHRTLSITNHAGSSMAREADVSFPTRAGEERAVPATKSFTAQLMNMYLLALAAAKLRGTLDRGGLRERIAGLNALPQLVEDQLARWQQAASEVAEKYRHARSFLYLGRGVHYAIAREGALKMKESSYVHAEGYPSGELKHGPNALVNAETPLVMLAAHDPRDVASVQRYRKVVRLMADLRAQGAVILAVANEGDDEVPRLANSTICVAPCVEPLLAVCEVVPLQLFAYFTALLRGVDVDNPRNLSKAVLAE